MKLFAHIGCSNIYKYNALLDDVNFALHLSKKSITSVLKHHERNFFPKFYRKLQVSYFGYIVYICEDCLDIFLTSVKNRKKIVDAVCPRILDISLYFCGILEKKRTTTRTLVYNAATSGLQ